MTNARRRRPRMAPLLLSLAVLAGAARPSSAVAQERSFHGVQFEASGLWTTLVGGAFPYDETGWGGTAGLHYRWPGGLSLGVVGMHAQPEDLQLAGGDVRRTMSQWGAFGELRYRLSGSTTVQPYMGARAGWTRLDDERGEPDGRHGNGFTYAVTVGTEMWPSDRFAFRLAAAGGGFTVSDFLQPGANTSANTWSVEAGFSVFLGSVTDVPDSDSDADSDGVPDVRDECAATPAGTRVDASGCGIDVDGDGMPYFRDECPGTASGARVDRRGCAADGDGDGVPDGRDGCPGTAEGIEVDSEGCALDADGDGVADGLDECPDTPSGVAVTERGCRRDGDADGVPDGRDRCPDTPEGMEVRGDGCSEIGAGLAEGRLTVSDIHFSFGSSRLDEASRELLVRVGRVLANRPEVRIRIRGHTDSIGPAHANLQIARARARAVRQFLLERFPGIGDDRLEAVGVGEGEPVASNGTPEGRSRNRRVEFVVVESGG